MPQRRDNSIALTAAVALVDALCIASAFYLTAYVTRTWGVTLHDHIVSHFEYLAVLLGMWYFHATDERLFVSRRGDALIPQLFAYTKALFLAMVMSIFILALLHRQPLDKNFTFTFIGLALVFMVLARTTMRLSIWGLRRRGYSYRRILVIGANERSAKVASVILSQRHYGFNIVGFMDDDPTRTSILEHHGIPYLGDVQQLEPYLANNVVDVVYISLPIRSSYEKIQSIAHLCEGVGVPVRLLADLFPLKIATSGLTRIVEVPLLSLSPFEELGTRTFMPRVIDISVSIILMALLSPVFLIVSLLLKLQSPRSPIFVWEHYATPRGQVVSLLKFRTWSTDGTADGPESAAKPATRPSALQRMGGLLQRNGLDELPQLVNILLGDMSHADPWRGLRPIQSAGDSASA